MTAQIIAFPVRNLRHELATALQSTIADALAYGAQELARDADLGAVLSAALSEEPEAVTAAPVAAAQAFEVGALYSCRSACDYDCVFTYEVVKRTAQRVTLRDSHGRVKTRKVHEYEGEETCYPEGTYSMCPVIRAGRKG